MNFHFPDQRALCLAENATHNLHNLLTLRGAEVRDARGWSRYLAEAIELFADDTDVAFASHHWPTWGSDNIVTLLTEQRDLYAYLHDQTLRLMNQGYVGSEIAEMIEMPPALDAAWHTHGYYGSVSHNVKAIYQRYLGWYDGNPAHLWQHPPEAAGCALRRGHRRRRRHRRQGARVRRRRRPALRRRARQPRRVRRPAHQDAADAADRGAHPARLRRRVRHLAQQLPHRRPGARQATSCRRRSASAGMASALTVTQLFDSIAIRIDGQRAWDTAASIRWHFTDSDETYRMELSNGVLIHYPTAEGRPGRRGRHPHQASSCSRSWPAPDMTDVQLDGDPGNLRRSCPCSTNRTRRSRSSRPDRDRRSRSRSRS